MKNFLLSLLLVATPLAGIAQVPARVSEIDLGAPISSIRTSADGKRAVAVIAAGRARPSGLLLLDTANPAAPIVQGFVAARPGSLSLSADGRIAIVASINERPGQYATTSQVAIFDLRDQNKPSIIENRDIPARNVIVATDASAYVYERPSSSQARESEAVIETASVPRQVTAFVREHDAARLDGTERMSHNYFVETGYLRALANYNLQGQGPKVQRQPAGGNARYRCIATILSDGRVLAEDSRFPRLGLYSNQPGIPRISTASHPQREFCRRLDLYGQDDHLVLGDNSSHVLAVSVDGSGQIQKGRSWRLATGTTAHAVAGHFLFASSGPGGQRLAVLNLEAEESSRVDWRVLAAVHKNALERYQHALHGKDWTLAAWKALADLESAGARDALDAPVVGVAPEMAARILNDFGFLSNRQNAPNDESEAAMRRAITLDPRRTSAYLNLADFLRGNLGSYAEYREKIARTEEIAALYRTYLALGGRHTPGIDAFLIDHFPADSGGDVCRAIAAYSNNGRINELISDRVESLQVGSRRLTLQFGTEGTAHVPAIWAYDASTDEPVDDPEFNIPGEEQMWGGGRLDLVSYGGRILILYYWDSTHLTSATPIGEGKGCEFSVSTAEIVGETASEPALCHELIAGKVPQAIDLETEAPISQEMVQKRYIETSANGMKGLDFANNGHPVNVGAMGLTSGAGPGCDGTFFDVLNRAGDAFGPSGPHEILMKLQGLDQTSGFRWTPLAHCENTAHFFRYGGKIYFEDKPATWPPVDKFNQYHRVARVESGKVREVCEIRFKTSVRASD